MAEYRELTDGRTVLVYTCEICKDYGQVHPLKENGRTDYFKAIPCPYCAEGKRIAATIVPKPTT